MYLTNNFRLREFTKSNVAEANGIDNSVKSNILLNSIIQLCENVLQPLRNEFGPVNILSGYRCVALNKMVGGADNSQHTKGEAADIYLPSLSADTLYMYIRDNMQFDQLILETTGHGFKWVHVSWTVNPRNQSFMLVK